VAGGNHCGGSNDKAHSQSTSGVEPAPVAFDAAPTLGV
jgi:hypothetical protein